jgi:hypothetical protein
MNHFKRAQVIVIVLSIGFFSWLVINSLGCNYSLSINSKDGYEYQASCQLGRFSYITVSPLGEVSKVEGLAIVLSRQIMHLVTHRESVINKVGSDDDLYNKRVDPIPFFTLGYQRLSPDKLALFQFPEQYVFLATIRGHVSTEDLIRHEFE